MTEETQNQAEEQTNAPADELTVLKQRATMMGIAFSNNISAATLRKKIEDKMAGEPETPDVSDQPNGFEAAAEVADAKDTTPATTKKPQSEYEKQYAEQMKLVRCRITCLNPGKKDLPGEIFTVANKVLGTVRKFIPYGEVTDDGYHIPYILYKTLDEKKFLHIRSTRDRRTGTPQVHTSWAKEFAIEVLPPLTPEELQKLATAQLAAGSVESTSSLD